MSAKVAIPSTNETTPSVTSVSPQLKSVVVHPLVLLSVVDHFNRMGKIGNQNRVVGVLLGSWSTKNQVIYNYN
jgi:26S proteasome regulatory subunit N8